MTRYADLTAKERVLLRLLQEGKSNKEIAATVHISPHTAGHWVQALMHKVGASSRTALAVWGVVGEIDAEGD